MVAGVAVLGVGALVAAGFLVGRPVSASEVDTDIPVGAVKRGDLKMTVHATGQLSASHTAMLTAPAVGGGALRIARLSAGRVPAKKDEIILEFDPSEQRYKLEQSRSELLQAEQEIVKAQADSLVLAAQDKVALLKARYGVRKAELDVQKREIVSAIDGAKYDAALKQAKRVLDELETDIKSHADSRGASVYLAREKLNKAKLAMDQAQENIDKMRVAAPMDGLISIQKNTDASGGLFFTGMSLPDYRAGDQVQPGSPVAQIVDPSGVELTADIVERERSNVRVGEAVEVVFDALPDHGYHGAVKSIGGISTHQFFEDNTAGTFNVSIQLADADLRLRPGMTAHLVFDGETRSDVLYVPRQAIFLKEGKSIVYLKHGAGYEPSEVKLLGNSESSAVIAGSNGGLIAGASVALIDPTAPKKQDSGSASSSATGGTL